MTLISKNVYIDKLSDIVNEYNNTYHRTIKMTPIYVKDITYIDSIKLHSSKEVTDKDPKFKVGDHVRISKDKKTFAKGYSPNWSEEVFVIKKSYKNSSEVISVISDLIGDEIIGTFYEKELQNTNQQESRIEKVIERKGAKLYVKWKGYDSSFNSWIDKKDLVLLHRFQFHCIKMGRYFQKLYELFARDINVKFDLSDYAAKTDIKNVSHNDTSNFALNLNLASLKSEVDKLDINKLVPVPFDLSKLM